MRKGSILSKGLNAFQILALTMALLLSGSGPAAGQGDILSGQKADAQSAVVAGPHSVKALFYSDRGKFVALPAHISLVAGETVVFTNHDTVSHDLVVSTARDVQGLVPASGRLSASFLQPKGTFSYQFTAPGAYEVFDPANEAQAVHVVVYEKENQETIGSYSVSQMIVSDMEEVLSSGAVASGAALPLALASTDVCSVANRTIYYDVVAMVLPVLPVNGWGDHYVNANVYALNNPLAYPNNLDLLVNPNLASPLILRANVGDCVVVRFRNEIPNKRVGMNIAGLTYDPNVSDGTRVGLNADTTVPTAPLLPASSDPQITYVWYADREGQYPINDMANTDPSAESDTMRIGLYGGFIVEPKDSVWRDPVSGQLLLQDIGGKLTGTGAPVFADIEVPGGSASAPNDFRDFALIFLDENDNILDKNGVVPGTTFGFNYRSEPLRNRMGAVLEHRSGITVTLPNGTVVKPGDNFCDGYDDDLEAVAPDQGAKCHGEEIHLQSWPFGDQGKLVTVLSRDPVSGQPTSIRVDSDNLTPKAYVGDPLRFRLIHPGQKEQHTFHQHQHRWFHEPDDPDSTRLDVQLVGPGQTFELRYEVGAGSGPGVPGDSIFHCHLYPHFADGFWGALRTFDRLRNASYGQTYPDGTPLQTLQELPDRRGLTTPAPTVMNPGFPLFVKGQYLQKAYRPPNFVTNDPYQAFRRPGDAVRAPTALERANMAGNNGKPGNDSTPGVFAADACPPEAPQRTYFPQAVGADPDRDDAFKSLVYNDAGNGNGTGGWEDPDGKIYIELSSMSGVMSGTEKAEPYVIRANMGDCANLRFTNRTHEDDLDRPENAGQPVPIDVHGDGETDLFGQQVFNEITLMSEQSIHTHMYMYDLLGSDGTSVGWNYDQSALVAQTVGYRFWVDMPLRTVYFHDHQTPVAGQPNGLYAVWNVEPTGATYQKLDGSPSNGVGPMANIIVPGGQSFREFTLFFADQVPGFRPAPDLPGNQGPPGRDLIPIWPPDEAGDHGDHGQFAINYRNAPFSVRLNPLLPSSDPLKNDPAYVLSSAVHGDPGTPLLKAYEGDPIVVRTMQGSNEEQHNFHIHGHRWLHEPDDPNSNIYDVQSFNIAEFFNFELDGAKLIKRVSGAERAREVSTVPYGSTMLLTRGAGPPGDYFYGSLPMDDLWGGMWGIMRIPAVQVPDLAPLPGTEVPSTGDPWPALKPPAEGQPIARTSGQPLTKAPSPTPQGDPCPTTARQKDFKVGAVTKKIVYNDEGDNDPNGLMYVLLDSAGNPKPNDDKPLFIRANEGECVNLTLTNLLPATGIPPHRGDTHPPEDIFPRLANGQVCTDRLGEGLCGVEEEGNVLDAEPRWPHGKRVSIHPHLLRYDPLGSDGATIGYNYDQTVAPGESITYRWYADTKNLGIANLADYGDLRGHRHHGLFGALVVEPRGAVYLNPKTNTPVESGEAAVIMYPEDGTTYGAYREFVIAFQDGINLYDRNGNPIPDLKAHPGDVQSLLIPRITDPEDQGHKGINYRTERFATRLAKNPQEAWVFSSDPAVGHGDPATPVFEAFAGDKVMLRVFNPQDKPRGHVFNIHGHKWRHEMNDPQSMVINAQGGFDTGRAFNLDLMGGAGGVLGVAGDYLYKCNVFVNHLTDGLWGILRVLNSGQAGGILPLASQPPQPNRGPVARGDTVVVPINSSSNDLNVLANDSDPDEDVLNIVSVSQASKGTTTISPAGTSILYSPTAGVSGSDTFTYVASDGFLTATATVTVTIQRDNASPVAVDDAFSVAANSRDNVLRVLDNDSDPNGGSFTITSLSRPANGTRAFGLSESHVLYTPAPGFSGTDTFSYVISNGVFTSTATITVRVNSSNRSPVAASDVSTVPINSSGNPIRVLANDSDEDGNPLMVSAVTQGSHGTVTIGPGKAMVLYSPVSGFSGVDEFSYTVTDGTSTATATVTVVVRQSNAPPVAVNDTATVAAGSTNNLITVLANDSDPDGDVVTISAVGPALGGALSIGPGGSSLMYSANAGFLGTDTFSYTISDGALTATATVTVTVVGENRPPVGMADTVFVVRNSASNSINVLSNDSDPDGNPVTIIAVSPATSGSVSIGPGGTRVIYTPNSGFTGVDTFTYTVSDGSLTSTATVTITVNSLPQLGVRAYIPMITKGPITGAW